MHFHCSICKQGGNAENIELINENQSEQCPPAEHYKTSTSCTANKDVSSVASHSLYDKVQCADELLLTTSNLVQSSKKVKSLRGCKNVTKTSLSQKPLLDAFTDGVKTKSGRQSKAPKRMDV